MSLVVFFYIQQEDRKKFNKVVKKHIIDNSPKIICSVSTFKNNKGNVSCSLHIILDELAPHIFDNIADNIFVYFPTVSVFLKEKGGKSPYLLRKMKGMDAVPYEAKEVKKYAFVEDE